MTATMKPPVMGLAEAAKACGVSVSTVRRKRDELRAHGAAETSRGWQIPVTALIAVGLMERTTDAPSSDTPRAAPDDALKAEVDALRQQLAAATQRAAVAEERVDGMRALVSAHERIIETQARALRMLEKGSTEQESAKSDDRPAEGHTALSAPVSPKAPDTQKDGHQPVNFLRRLLRGR